MGTGVRFFVWSIVSIAAVGVLVFPVSGAPASWPEYRQGWIFLAVFALATLIPGAYLLRVNPAALRRRLRGGPLAETRPVQKFASAAVLTSIAGSIVLSALGHRLGGWTVPEDLCIAGNVLVALGLTAMTLVVVQNAYAAATVTIEVGQRVVAAGLYRVVRHPMYAATVLLILGIPPALGSLWGWIFLAPGVAGLVVRIRDEEAMLTQALTGYRDYIGRVRYRLIPAVW